MEEDKEQNKFDPDTGVFLSQFWFRSYHLISGWGIRKPGTFELLPPSPEIGCSS